MFFPINFPRTAVGIGGHFTVAARAAAFVFGGIPELSASLCIGLLDALLPIGFEMLDPARRRERVTCYKQRRN